VAGALRVGKRSGGSPEAARRGPGLPETAGGLSASRFTDRGAARRVRELGWVEGQNLVVMAGGGDPVASGLVKSLARPGGNVTGVSLLGQELVPKALSLLREVVPRAKRVNLLANAANPANAFFGRVTAEAGQALGVESRLLEVRRPDELEPAIKGTQADALLALADPMFSLMFNLRTARALGLTIPPSLLHRADQVFQ